MTAALDESRTKSRRAILAAAVGGLAALAAEALGRPTAVRAGSDGDVVLGANNYASSGTLIDTGFADVPFVFRTSSSGSGDGIRGASHSGDGVYGASSSGSGVAADSTSGVGVYGKSFASVGVKGHSTNFVGVWGESDSLTGVEGRSTSWVGTYGHSDSRLGVLGVSGASEFPVPAKTGVFGYAILDTSARGVHGQTTSGQGVRGEATSGIGVFATATTGHALLVSGRAAFKRSGRTSVPINRAYVDVIVAGGLSSSASVLATLQAYRSGVYVTAVRSNYPSAGKARIYLNKIASTTSTTPVAWFVFG
jgi:hypothetical protein